MMRLYPLRKVNADAKPGDLDMPMNLSRFKLQKSLNPFTSERNSKSTTHTFLEKIYLRSLDGQFFSDFHPKCDMARVETIVGRYREIISKHSFVKMEEEGRIPTTLLEEMGEIGIFGLTIPESYGGLGFNLWEYLKVLEEMVKLEISVALAAIAHLSIGIKAILLYGNEAQKKKYLTPAASGHMIFSYALTEPRVGSDAQHIETRAELSENGSHYILNGQKTYITNANYSKGFTVFAQMDGNKPGYMGAFIVERDMEGVIVGKDMPKMGLKASSTAPIHLRDVRVPIENLIGNPGDGFKIAMSVLNYGRLGLGGASSAMMSLSLQDMKKRAASRIQFSVPIKNFPLIQEKIVKTRTDNFVASAMNEFVAGLLEKDPLGNVAIESSHCKLFGTTRAWDTLYEALQIAGGAGYISTQPYEKRMRDFRVATVFEGTTEIHSIYPPLFMMRNFSKELEVKGNGFSKFRYLLHFLFSETEWPLTFNNPTMEKASRVAKANACTIKRLFLLGLMVHGKKTFEKEFYLRRITTLSLYSFGLLAVLFRLSAEEKAGGKIKEQDLNLLRYFTEEAKEVRKKNSRFFDSKRERLTGRIAEQLFNSREDC